MSKIEMAKIHQKVSAAVADAELTPAQKENLLADMKEIFQDSLVGADIIRQ